MKRTFPGTRAALLVFLVLVLVCACGLALIVRHRTIENELLQALALKDNSKKLTAEGTNLLINIGERAVPVLLSWSSGRQPDWYRVINPVLRALKKNPLTNEIWASQLNARAAAAILRGRAKDAVPGLVKRLSDPDPAIRRYSIQILGAIGPTMGTEAFQKMTNCLSDSNHLVRNEVVWSLQYHRPQDYPLEVVLPVFLIGLKDSDGGVRVNSMLGFHRLGEKAEPARAEIEKSRDDDRIKDFVKRWLEGRYMTPRR